MPKTSNKSASRVDKLVGRNIRVHRLVGGLTQEGLGEKLGVTFQQIQKYEKGTNRVGSGRLYQIAALLEVPVTAFFEGGETQTGTRASAAASPYDLLADPVSLRMVQAFSEIADQKTRRAVLALVESMTAK
ncbi:MAG TPA: helix-turn-helix transcriptional regulator [Xanthobacteraceae bacterium]|nr:helix-turn-helix transcriptional regulator [Xanthobacteraceae bacterium]